MFSEKTKRVTEPRGCEMCVTWLHLSDLHVTNSTNMDMEYIVDSFFEDLNQQLNKYNYHLDFIFFTGDIAFSGKKNEYKKAIPFFDELLNRTGLQKNQLFVIPGNHDLDRDQPQGIMEEKWGSMVNADQVAQVLDNDTYRTEIGKRFFDYNEFLTKYFNEEHPDLCGDGYLPGSFALHTQVERVFIVGLNSAWFSGLYKDDKGEIWDHGRLLIGDRQINHEWKKIRDQVQPGDITIFLSHHPLGSLQEFDQQECEMELYKNCKFLLHGHLHNRRIFYGSSSLHENNFMVTTGAGAVFGGKRHHNAYNIVTYDIEKQSGKIYMRRYYAESKKWSKDPVTEDESGICKFKIKREKDKQNFPKLDQKLGNLPIAQAFPELDYLMFEKGIQFCQGRSVFGLVKGRPGSGKSTFALQLVSNIAKAKENKFFVNLYFTIEEGTESVFRQAENFGWDGCIKKIDLGFKDKQKDEEQEVALDKYLDDHLENILKDTTQSNSDGCVVISSTPGSSFEKRLENLITVVPRVVNSLKNIYKDIFIGVIVIDSLPGLVGDKPKRFHLLELRKALSDCNSLVVFITEDTGKAVGYDFEEYIADIVIEMGTLRQEEYLLRYIEILKARHQSHALGRHQVKIKRIEESQHPEEQDTSLENQYSKSGIMIFPSPHLYLSKTRNLPTLGQKVLSTGIDGLNRLLSGKGASYILPEFYEQGRGGGKEGRNQVPLGVQENSCTAIIGERNSRKSLIGMNFLLEGLKQGERVLLISLRESKESVLSTELPQQKGAEYKKLEELKEYDKQKKLNILYLRPGFIAVEEFTDKVLRELGGRRVLKQGARAEGDKQYNNYSRVVFDDVSQLQMRFPLLAKSPIFLPMLIDIFKAAGITSMFIAATDSIGESSANVLNIAALADNFVQLKHKTVFSNDYVVVRVGRIKGKECTGEPYVFEVSNNELEIKPLFSGIIGLDTDDPKHSDIILEMYTGKSDIRKEFNNHVYTIIKRNWTKLDKKEFTADEFDMWFGRNYSQSDVLLDHTKVFMLDEFSLPQDKKEQENLLLLNSIFSNKQLKQNAFVNTEFTRVSREGNHARDVDEIKTYAIPFVLNMTVLCCHDENVARILMEYKDKKLTWEQVFKYASQVHDDKRLIIDFNARSPESINCMFLELFLSGFGADDPIDQLNKWFDGQIENDKEIVSFVADQFVEFRKYAGFPARDIHSLNGKQGDCPLFSFQWYSTFQEEFSLKAKQKTILFAPPSGGIVGDWYIGAAKRSASRSSAKKVIVDLYIEDIDRKKIDFGIGLPIYEQFYKPEAQYRAWKNGPGLYRMMDMYKGCWRRSMIRGYTKIKDEIRHHFEEILLLQEETQEIEKEKIINILKRLQHRVM